MDTDATDNCIFIRAHPRNPFYPWTKDSLRRDARIRSYSIFKFDSL